MKKQLLTFALLLTMLSARAITVTDQATLKTAIASGLSVSFGNNITITDSIAFSQQPIKQDINGNNFQLIVKTPSGTAFYRDQISVVAANQAIDMALNIHDVVFIGTIGKGWAIRLSATYGTWIHDNWFKGFRVGVQQDFCLNNTVERNRFWSQSYAAIINSWKAIPGGNSSTTQSNVYKLQENCIRVDSGAFAGIIAEGSSGGLIIHNVIEGGNAAHYGSQYGIYFDYSGSPNVKSVFVSWNHFEVIFTKSRFRVRIADGNVVYWMNYYQYGGNDIEPVSEGYATIHAWDPDYIPTATTNTAGSAVWDFRNYPYPFNETASQYWQLGTIPYYRTATGYGEGADKYEYLRANPAPKLNGKNYVTQ